MRKRFSDEDEKSYRSMLAISEAADKGESILCSMGSQKKMPFSLDDLHFLPAQISKVPLNADEAVSTKVVVGPEAKKPLTVSSPIMFGGMSYGAVSKNVRLVLARVAANSNVGLNSGEDVILPEELEIAPNQLIVQYCTVRRIPDETLKKCAAIEIRFGQGAYPGWPSLLPAAKVSPEIAELKGIKQFENEYTPAHHPDIRNSEQLKKKIASLKELTGGTPVGAKIGCGNIEDDVEILAECGADFISIDGFGAATGATQFFIRENVGVPIIAALPRADKHLKKIGKRGRTTLIASGGLRTSADFAKCLALGANAVYIGTSALIAINCEQYRLCHTGHCPTGVTTNDPVLTQRLDVGEGIRKLTNFMNVSNNEIAGLLRVVGKDDVRKLETEDLVALKKDLSEATGVKWLNRTIQPQRERQSHEPSRDRQRGRNTD
jgi:glutamate synthase domain-containing protein 2